MKYLAIIMLTISLVLPTNIAFAGISVQDNFANQILQNTKNAKSVEFALNGELVIQNMRDNSHTQSFKANVNGSASGLQSTDKIMAVDASYSSKINGKEEGKSGKAVVTEDRLYFVDNANGEWFFVDTNKNATYKDVSEGVNNASDDLKFDAFVITNRLSDVQVNGVTMSRFEFTINADEIVKLMKASGKFSEKDLSDAKSYISENVQFNGVVWVNMNDMLPYKVAINSTVTDENQNVRITANVDLVFKSFNKQLNIQEPTGATDLIEQISNGHKDPDNDGLTNNREKQYGSDPNNPDTDGDGFNDGVEVKNGYNPVTTGQLDSDKDTIGDHDEMLIWNTNRYKADTDNDGYNDDVEIRYLYNPRGAGVMDTDKDGLSDHDELFIWHTNRFKTDTDNDGYSDYVEVTNRYNPNGRGRI